MDLKRKLINEMTLWRVTGHTGSGAPVVSSPELILVRYSDSDELIHTNPGEELYQRALIITDESFNEGDLIIDGDLTLITDPIEAGADEVKRVTRIPSLKGDYKLYIYHV
jgi:hypothetical protein